MKIITLTLSPAFDLHCYAKEICVGHENLATVIRREAGGKGVNISRALRANSKDSLCLALLGEENGDEFKKSLASYGLELYTLTLSGRIRENITLHTESGKETRISFKGFSADPSVLDRIAEQLEKIGLSDATVTFTGRAPTGIGISRIKDFLKALQRKGARIVIDSRSFTLSDLTDCSPYLIKPNEEEISAYMGRNISTQTEAAEVGRAICKTGVENVMITLGDRGAVLVSSRGVWTATPPRIDVVSTIGAGDSSIAGFLSAISEGADESQALRLAVAFGSAACLTVGTLPPRKEDVDRILSQVKINRI